MSLRAKVISGGFYLAMRQSIGMAISLGGVLLLTRLIGPEQYGLYAATAGIFWYIQTVCQMGVEVYLIRHEGEENLTIYHQGFTLLLLLGLGGMVISLLTLPMLQSWVRLTGFSDVMRVFVLGLPIVLISQVASARLERQLDYRRVALIELFDQIVYYLVALLLAFQGWGVWAAVTAWAVQMLQGTGLVYWASRYRPRFYWDDNLVKQMLRYGLGFSTSLWIWYARSLVNPLIIGRLAGAEAVAFVAIAIRMVEVLGFVKTATWRLAIATLSKFQLEQRRLINAVSEGMGLQILALGPLLVSFAIVSPWVIPLIFGAEWAPVIGLFPFIALGSLTNSLFNMHSSALYVLKHNWDVTAFHLVHIVLFVGATLWLVPSFGLAGYGWAEVVALLSYGVIHRALVRRVGHPDYDLSVLWWAAFAVALFVHPLGWGAIAGLVGVACLPATHRQIRAYVKSIGG